ncbi:hypothetical protein RUM43_014419 [Polyplax serrata]|uniref:Mediator of RNA polymerase II transcription subunit 26 n=1 Tax=Polyplax serrata TaxID=468196 RepID=A0AAN8P4V5_POLSC
MDFQVKSCFKVVDMPVVVEIIGILERTSITKDDLETTRLGKYVNELRRKTTNEQVAKRAKDLVRKWRDMITSHSTVGADGVAGRNQNGTRPPMTAGRIVSPAIGRSLSPGSWTRSCPISPALSLKRSQPSSPASRINSLSPDNSISMSPGGMRQTISPSISPTSQIPSSKVNQSLQLPHSSGEPTTVNLPPGTPIMRTPEQSPSTPAPRPRGRPPLNRTSSDTLKSPSRPRGRPPLDYTDGDLPRGRGRPPLDPSLKAEHRGRGRPPLSSSPSGVPRGRGRPPKNKNKLKNLTSSESNQNSNLVPKNSPANKRLRKSSDEEQQEDLIAKKQKLNGVYDCKVPDLLNMNEENTGKDPSQVPSELVKIPKKRGRKKGSKNTPKNLSFDRYEEDVVKEKIASIVRNPKVKTTRELLECIQKESSLDNLRNKTLSSLGVDGEKSRNSSPSHKLLNKNEISDYDMTMSKTEHIHKFLRSQNEAEDDFGHRSAENNHREVKYDKSEIDSKTDSRPLSRVSDVIVPTVPSESSKSLEILEPAEEDIIDVEKIDSIDESPMRQQVQQQPKPKKLETVEEILAKLPVINPDEILWSESDLGDGGDGSSSSDSSSCGEDERRGMVKVTEADVDWLHGEHIPEVNGNWNEGRLIENLNHGLKVPIPNIESDGDTEPKPNSKPNTETVGNDEQLDRNSNNLETNKVGRHDDNFREWQECVSKISYNGELLHILPYVIID